MNQSNNQDKKVAFIGLGVMGYPMAGHWAKRLAKQLSQSSQEGEIRVYNRTQSRADSWMDRVAQECRNIHPTIKVSTSPNVIEAVQDIDVVATCLGGDPDLRMIYFDQSLIDTMKPGSLIIDHTTASAQIARQIHAAAKKKNIGFLDAPISGGQIGAENGTLSVMVGGDEKDFSRGLVHMEAYGKNIVHIGENGSGQTTKMVNQICIAGLLQGLAEGLAFGKKSGLDMERVMSVISKGASGSWQMEQRSSTMLSGKYDFGFAVKWMIKDLNIALEEAERIGANCHFTSEIKKLYEIIREQGGENYDTSSLMLLTDK